VSIEKRLQRLETRSEKTDNRPEEKGYWGVTMYLREVENCQRAQEGLLPIPYTEEELRWERFLDEEFLQDGLPRMRASPGWQSIEAQAQLDEWEHEIREKHSLEKGDS
jgi:hypothetical protein